jgi:hypothetical protein
MGDIADMILDGDMCQGCGKILSGLGYPTFCRSCQQEENINAQGEKKAQKSEKINCPICNKRVKKAGLAMHTIAVHNDQT